MQYKYLRLHTCFYKNVFLNHQIRLTKCVGNFRNCNKYMNQYARHMSKNMTDLVIVILALSQSFWPLTFHDLGLLVRHTWVLSCGQTDGGNRNNDFYPFILYTRHQSLEIILWYEQKCQGVIPKAWLVTLTYNFLNCSQSISSGTLKCNGTFKNTHLTLLYHFWWWKNT